MIINCYSRGAKYADVKRYTFTRYMWVFFSEYFLDSTNDGIFRLYFMSDNYKFLIDCAWR